jgi:hypothetical protein
LKPKKGRFFIAPDGKKLKAKAEINSESFLQYDYMLVGQGQSQQIVSTNGLKEIFFLDYDLPEA